MLQRLRRGEWKGLSLTLWCWVGPNTEIAFKVKIQGQRLRSNVIKMSSLLGMTIAHYHTKLHQVLSLFSRTDRHTDRHTDTLTHERTNTFEDIKS